jgi:hypothetical protein
LLINDKQNDDEKEGDMRFEEIDFENIERICGAALHYHNEFSSVSRNTFGRLRNESVHGGAASFYSPRRQKCESNLDFVFPSNTHLFPPQSPPRVGLSTPNSFYKTSSPRQFDNRKPFRFSISVNGGSSVEVLKDIIYTKIKIPVSNQLIVVQGKILHDLSTIKVKNFHETKPIYHLRIIEDQF